MSCEHVHTHHTLAHNKDKCVVLTHTNMYIGTKFWTIHGQNTIYTLTYKCTDLQYKSTKKYDYRALQYTIFAGQIVIHG